MSRPTALCTLAPGPGELQRLQPNSVMARHRHHQPYAALVLCGAYLEAGDAGRRLVEAGDVIFHGPFEAHTNQAHPRGAVILNLPLSGCPGYAFGVLPDIDLLVRTAERDVTAACELLLVSARPSAPQYADWTDLLAETLRVPGAARLEDWARDQGLSPSTLSRRFRQQFGVSPKRYQLEARTQWAINHLRVASSLTELALEAGFADHAHMCRAVRDMTGQSPSSLRRADLPHQVGRHGRQDTRE